MPAAATDTPAPAFWLAIWTLTRREMTRFFRQRTRIVGAVGQPILFWLLFGAGLHGSFAPPSWAPRDMTYQEYFFPGVAVLIVLFTAIFSTISIIEDRREGFLQGVLVSPVSRLAIVLGKLTGGTLLSLLQAGLFLAIAPWLGLRLTPGVFAAILGYMTLVAFAMTGLGFLIAWPLDSTQGFHAIMSVFLMPMWLLSGAFFPAGESGWLSWIMRLNPLTYGVAGLRRLLYWGQDLPASAALPSFATCLAVTAGFAAACVVASAILAERRDAKDRR